MGDELKRRLWNIAIMLDQSAWVLLTLGHGCPDETISAAMWRMEMAGKWQGKVFRPLIDLIFYPFEKGHCFESYRAEMWRRQLPQEYQK